VPISRLLDDGRFLYGGQVIDLSQKLCRVTDVTFADGRVVAVGDGLVGDTICDVAGKIVTPRLMDLHSRVYWSGTSLGIDAEGFADDGDAEPGAGRNVCSLLG
jgi:dihydroorotase